MGTHNICLYKEVDKKYTGCNLKTTELLNYALTGVFAVMRSNIVCRSHMIVSHITAILSGDWFLIIFVFFISAT